MRVLLSFALVALSLAAEPRKLATIDFFGYTASDDLPTIRKTLPFREGGTLRLKSFTRLQAKAKKAAKSITGREVTDVSLVCCNEGGWGVYIGLGSPAPTQRRIRPAPTGGVRLPSEIPRFYEELMDASQRLVKAGPKGDGGAYERKTAELRKLAAQQEPLLLDVIANSSEAPHRAAAAFALGHGLAPSPARIAVLVDASADPNSTVRNNAARGLIAWAAQRPREIPPNVFIEMVQSGSWTDRNKGVNVLQQLAETRDPKILAAIHERAVAALREIAAWRWEGHAGAARRILELLAVPSQ